MRCWAARDPRERFGFVERVSGHRNGDGSVAALLWGTVVTRRGSLVVE